MAVYNAAAGPVLCATIIWAPFGLLFFKIARLSLMLFRAKICGIT